MKFSLQKAGCSCLLWLVLVAHVEDVVSAGRDALSNGIASDKFELSTVSGLRGFDRGTTNEPAGKRDGATSVRTDTPFSRKEVAFVSHAGRAEGVIIKVQTTRDKNATMSLKVATSHCRSDPRCVGFTYALLPLGVILRHNLSLKDIQPVFLSAVHGLVRTSLEPDGSFYQTYLLNNTSIRAPTFDLNGIAHTHEETKDAQNATTCCEAVQSKTDRQELPLDWLDRVRPAVEAVDTLPRIDCNSLSPNEFMQTYEKHKLPVMLTSCADRWPASRKWTPKKLRKRFDNSTTFRVGVSDRGWRRNVKWSTVLELAATNKSYYVFDQLDHPAAKVLDRDYADPAPFTDTDLYKTQREVYDNNFNGPLRWFCMGTKGTGTGPHPDPYATDAWNTVISGMKWWIIYPNVPSLSRQDVSCHEECSTGPKTAQDWFASIAVHAAQTEYHPDQNQQTAIHVLQKPGETLYVPAGMLHSVLNVGELTIAITRNYASSVNLDAVWDKVKMEKSKRRIMYNVVLDASQRAHVRNVLGYKPRRAVNQKEKPQERVVPNVTVS